MDPFTLMAISSMAPMAMSMLTPQPQFPGMSPVNQVGWQQLQPFQGQMLQNAFSPQSNLLNIALQKGGASVDNNLANRGLAQSSMGDALRRQSATDITNQWLQNETNRQAMAYGAAARGLGDMSGVANMQNQDAWQRYLQTQKNNAAFGQGLGSMIGGLGGAYAGYQQNQQNQNNFNTMMGALYSNPSGYTGGTGPLSTMSVGG